MKMLLSVLVIAMLSLTAMAQEAAAPAETSAEAADVESSVIKSVSYNAETQVLTVVMVKDEITYEYADVPESVYNDLMAAESKGAFFVKSIKGKYETVRK